MLESPENRVMKNGFAFREHILATTSHDGTLANTYTECSTAVVCDNTFAAAMGERGRRYTSKHSKNAVIDIEGAREALGILVEGGNAFEDWAMSLTKKRVSAQKFGEFVEAWAPVPEDPKNNRGRTVAEKKRATLTELYKSDDRVTPWKGTAFGVVQAVNTYGQHYAAVRNGADSESGKGAIRYARSILAAADGTLAQQGASRLVQASWRPSASCEPLGCLPG
jgi:phage/plasmid-like protein (TIGR03299 family)